MKKLSVLVPAYNFGDYLPSCIDSIYKQQTTFDFDVIVRDDNSPDNSSEVLNNLKQKYPNLIVLDGSKNIGAFHNIKLLYESTDAQYVAYLDGDDMFGDLNKLQRQVDFLDKNPEYVMHFTGSRYLYEDGTIFPNDSRVICSIKKVITTKDLLEGNYVGFGRMFRNKPNIFKEKYSELPYVDWPTSYELSKYGLIVYEEFFGGIYRISQTGMYSTLSDQEKEIGANKVQQVIKDDYYKENYKTITILDCFISNEAVLGKLILSLTSLKKHGHTILLVTNKVPPQEVIELVDYLIYNHENKLFKQKYDNIGLVDLWKVYDGFTIHEITEELQRHGLSVMCNLFNSLDLAKSLGYTHFQKMEIDGIFTDEGYDFMGSVPELINNENKKSLFYFNDTDTSFHYFYSEIDFFLSNVDRVTDEESYRNYLRNNGFNDDFKPVEVYLYHNLITKNSDLIIKRNGEEEMNTDFPNTMWNTETSQSTLSEYYRGCSTKIYLIKDQTNYSVLSFNYNDFPVYRKIIVELDDREEIIHHQLDYNGSWSYNIFDETINKIRVYDSTTDELLYEMKNKNIYSYIEFD
jgi:glycosyltransferase involved in cell wall biosynthesis